MEQKPTLLFRSRQLHALQTRSYRNNLRAHPSSKQRGHIQATETSPMDDENVNTPPPLRLSFYSARAYIRSLNHPKTLFASEGHYMDITTNIRVKRTVR
jgi:hypothetical protein